MQTTPRRASRVSDRPESVGGRRADAGSDDACPSGGHTDDDPRHAGAAGGQPTPAFAPFWVKNHRVTEMWSGPADAPGVVSFGTTSRQFCSFRVVLPPESQRLYVFNPYSQNYFWIDADAVGPVGPPEQRAGPPPSGQNCAEVIYTG